jgi:hypothetical protein
MELCFNLWVSGAVLSLDSVPVFQSQNRLERMIAFDKKLSIRLSQQGKAERGLRLSGCVDIQTEVTC